MKKLNKFLSLLISFSMISTLSVFSVAQAETTNATTKSWNISQDWKNEGSPQNNAWGDAYGNENVWRVGGWSGNNSNPTLTDWVYSVDNGANHQKEQCGYFVPEGKPGTNYLSLGKLSNPNGYNLVTSGTGHFYEWTAPENMSVDFGFTFAQNNWRYSGSYLRILKKSADAESWSLVKHNGNDGTLGENGSTRTERFYVKKGDKLLFTVECDTYRDANFQPEVFYSLDLSVREVEATDWDFQADWITVGKPQSNKWGDPYGNENVWRAGSWSGLNYNPALTDWEYSADNGAKHQTAKAGYLVPSGKPGTNYLSLGKLNDTAGYSLVTKGADENNSIL